MSPRENFQRALNVSRETLEQFDVYSRLLMDWQKKINLIGPATIDDVWTRHFLDSAQLKTLVDKTLGPKDGRSWLDLGSGAGFPGLVLSLLGEGPVYLVEPSAKRCAFLRAVIRETGGNAEVLQAKAQDLNPFPVDIVTSRALSNLRDLLDWGAPFLGQGGEFWFLKGESADEELTSAMKTNNMHFEIFSSQTNPQGKIIRLRK